MPRRRATRCDATSAPPRITRRQPTGSRSLSQVIEMAEVADGRLDLRNLLGQRRLI